MRRVYLSLIAICSIITLVWFNINYSNAETPGKDEVLSKVLDEIWIEYDILAYSVLITDSVLYFVIDDNENKSEVTQGIEKKIEQNDIEGYTLEIVKEKDVD